jgi:peptidoglycan/LPS O-acetylase OafA/YrhL
LKLESGAAATANGHAEGLAWLTGGRVPCLDGLRALSIALVLFGHGAGTVGSPIQPQMRALARFGSQGVDVFFVISGFLITLLLLREEWRRGCISLRAFYARRAFRILPAYFAYLGFVLLLTQYGADKLRPIHWAGAMTYTTNFLPGVGSGWLVGHTWSLSVEEHFYLFWPPALVLLGRQRARSLLLVLFATAPVVRYSIWTMHRDWLDIDYVTPARIDTIVAGCLLAYLVTGPRGLRWMQRLERHATIVFLAAVLVMVASASLLSLSGKYVITLRGTVESAAIAACLLAVISGPRSAVGQLFETRPMAVVGALSYSLYLWQQPFLRIRSELWMCRRPQNLVLAVTAAIVSYLLVERPFLRLKDRLGQRTASPGPSISVSSNCVSEVVPVAVSISQ